MMQKLGILAVAVLLCGCGKASTPTTHLSGAVTIDGKPIPAEAQAALSFVPAQGGKVVSVHIVGGRYDSPDTPEGKISVKFDISQPVGPEKVSERTGEKYREIANLVPPDRAAGIVIEVQGDDSQRDFDL
jgi:hypothetical protein